MNNSTNKPKMSTITNFFKNINVKPKNYSTNKLFHIIITIILIFTLIGIVIYLGYLFIQSSFFIEKLNKVITLFNEFIRLTASILVDQTNISFQDILNANKDTPTPKTRTGKILWVTSLIKTTHPLLYKILYIYIVILGIFSLLLLVLIVVKPSILKIIEPKGQELQDKILTHNIKNHELDSTLVPLRAQIKNLIDMSTENLSFSASYRHSLNIWKQINLIDGMLADVRTKFINDVLVSNQIRSIIKNLNKIFIRVSFVCIMVSYGLNLGLFCYLSYITDSELLSACCCSTLIIQLLGLFVKGINLLAGFMFIVIMPILFILALLVICNNLYNYNLYIIYT